MKVHKYEGSFVQNWLIHHSTCTLICISFFYAILDTLFPGCRLQIRFHMEIAWLYLDCKHQTARNHAKPLLTFQLMDMHRKYWISKRHIAPSKFPIFWGVLGQRSSLIWLQNWANFFWRFFMSTIGCLELHTGMLLNLAIFKICECILQLHYWDIPILPRSSQRIQCPMQVIRHFQESLS